MKQEGCYLIPFQAEICVGMCITYYLFQNGFASPLWCYLRHVYLFNLKLLPVDYCFACQFGMALTCMPDKDLMKCLILHPSLYILGLNFRDFFVCVLIVGFFSLLCLH